MLQIQHHSFYFDIKYWSSVLFLFDQFEIYLNWQLGGRSQRVEGGTTQATVKEAPEGAWWESAEFKFSSARRRGMLELLRRE